VRVLRRSPTLPLVIGLALAGSIGPPRLAAQDAVVRAVLFYSPTCPHCHKVMTEDLPPLAERYGDQLVIVGVDVTSRVGQELFQAALAHFGIPLEDAGVPMLVAGEEVMIGALEIPERLPGLIERALAADGIDWPAVAQLRDALAAQGLMPHAQAPRPDSSPAPAAAATDTAARVADAGAAVDTAASAANTGTAGDTTTTAADTIAVADAAPPGADSVALTAPAADRPTDSITAAAPPAATAPPAPPTPGITRSLTPEAEAARASVLDRLRRDPFGNGIAVAVMVLLVAVLAASVRLAFGRSLPGDASPPAWLVPALCVLGMAVAAYLSFVEVTGQEAVCGPVGDCNAVQQSTYARLFGVLPVGVLGMIGYAAIFVTWSVARSRAVQVGRRALWLQWAMAFAATTFSWYLTFLEPFVIGATCMWCISSAVIVGLLLLTTSVELRRSIA